MNHHAVEAGALDPNFGDGGVVDLSNEAKPTNPMDILALADGKFLYADWAPDAFVGNPGIRVRRINANGSFDRSFGEDGQLLITLPRHNIASVKLSAYLEGGWLLTCYHSDDPGGYGVPHVVVIRIGLNGRLVPFFGNGGILMLDALSLLFPPGQSTALVDKQAGGDDVEPSTPIATWGVEVDVTVLPSGKIVVLYGWTLVYDALLIQLLPDGSLDYDFNEGKGFSLIRPPGTYGFYHDAHRLAVQADGKFLICGAYNTAAGNVGYIMRVDSNGRFDSSFNGGQVVTLADSNPDTKYHLFGDISVRETDGAILAAGYAGPTTLAYGGSGFITVLNENGSFNLVFNRGKPLFSKIIPEGQTWHFCAWQKNKEAIIIGGDGGDSLSDRQVVVSRFLLDGTLDTSFNRKGWTAYPSSLYLGMAITQDNKIGLCVRVNLRHSHVLRYLTS